MEWFVSGCSLLLTAMSCAFVVPVRALGNSGTAGQDWVTESHIVIGGEPGSDSALLSLRSVSVVGNGNRIVVSQSRRITVWDPARLSAPVLEFGRRYDAPPFGNPRGSQTDSAGLWIRYDSEWGRFSHDGRLSVASSHAPDEWDGLTMILADRSFLAREPLPPPSRVFSWGTEHPGWRVAIAHIRPVGEGWEADTLAIYNSGGRVFGVAWGGDQQFSGQPFADYDLIYFDASAGTVGIVYRRAGNGEVTVLEIAPGGDTVFSAQVRVPPVPLDQDRAEEAIQAKVRQVSRMLGQRGDTVSAPAVRRMVEDALYVPTHLPPVTSVVPTASGQLWLRTIERADTLAVWYVLDRTKISAPPRRVLLPNWFVLRAATRTHIWGLRRDGRFSGQVQGRRLTPR